MAAAPFISMRPMRATTAASARSVIWDFLPGTFSRPNNPDVSPSTTPPAVARTKVMTPSPSTPSALIPKTETQGRKAAKATTRMEMAEIRWGVVSRETFMQRPYAFDGRKMTSLTKSLEIGLAIRPPMRALSHG